uniref:Uncharacterized protein n=1 Tax=Tanacetum cinerariifolium TaxID=118510 RepID=A0A6L2KEN7_TANCI|nr:hypothetical protein [Tanacetum cinerariifolium]
MVLNLKTIKNAQAQEITSLKKKVKRLEKKRWSRTHGLKRLYKVGLSAKVESSTDKENEDIFSVNDQDVTLMFDADKDLQGEEVNATSITTPVSAAATTTTAATTLTICMDEITLAKALIEIKTSRPKAKGFVMQELNETPTPTPIVFSQQPSKVQDKGKEIMVEESLKMKKKVRILFDKEVARKLQEDIYDKKNLKEKEKRRKFFAAKRDEERRKKPPTKAQQRSIMNTYLNNMDRWKPRALKNKSFAVIKELFDKAMERINSFVDFKTELVEESTKKAQEEIAQESNGVTKEVPITTAEEKAQRRLEVKTRSTLMMGIPNEHQLKFNSIKDAKQLLEDVEKRFVNTAQVVNNANGVSTASTQVNAAYSTNIDNLSDVICSFFASQPNSPQLVHKDLEQIHLDDIEEMDLRWQMAMLTMKGRKFLKKTRKKLTVNGNKTIGFDKSKAEDGPNYPLMAFLSSISDLKVSNDSTKFMPPTPGLFFTGLDEFVNKPVVKNCKARSSEEETKVVRKNNDAPIIEEWVSDNKEEDVS